MDFSAINSSACRKTGLSGDSNAGSRAVNRPSQWASGRETWYRKSGDFSWVFHGLTYLNLIIWKNMVFWLFVLSTKIQAGIRQMRSRRRFSDLIWRLFRFRVKIWRVHSKPEKESERCFKDGMDDVFPLFFKVCNLLQPFYLFGDSYVSGTIFQDWDALGEPCQS